MRTDIALIPLDKEVRATLPTAEAAAHLNRAEQTLRLWATGTVKCPIEPLRVNGRLAWSVARLTEILGVEGA